MALQLTQQMLHPQHLKLAHCYLLPAFSTFLVPNHIRTAPVTLHLLLPKTSIRDELWHVFCPRKGKKELVISDSVRWLLMAYGIRAWAHQTLLDFSLRPVLHHWEYFMVFHSTISKIRTPRNDAINAPSYLSCDRLHSSYVRGLSYSLSLLNINLW